MSRSPSDIVRSAYDAFGRRDLPALLALLDDDVEIVDPELPGGGTFSGHHGAIHYVQEWLNAFEAHTLEVVRLIEEGGRIVAAVHQAARVRGSTAEVTMDDAHVWTIADGRVTRVEMHFDLDSALDAVRGAA